MTAQELKNSILMQAVQGKLVPQDPNDEPASVLLAKIRAEKEQMMKEGKIKKEPISEIYVDPSDNQHYEKVGKTVKCIEDEIPFEIPNTWQWTSIRNIAFVTKLAGFEYTKYIAPNIKNSGIPLFKGKNVQKGKLVYSFEGYIPEILSDELQRSQINKKCLLTPYVGTIGNIAIFPGNFKAHLGSNVGKIEVVGGLVLEEYVMYYFRSSAGYKELTKHKKATAQESISIEAIREVFIPIPPIIEQQRIVNRISEFETYIEKYKDLYEKINLINTSISGKLKKSILQYAIQGKLVAQSPDDEPASELIKRIRAEKEKLIKSGKLKKDKNESFIYRGSDNSYYEKFQNGKEICIDDEIPFEIPKSWGWCRLSNVCKLIDGQKATISSLPIMDAKFLRGKPNINYANNGKFAAKGTYLILVDGENAGEVFIAPNDGYMGSTFKMLWISSEVNSSYILNFIELHRIPLKNSKKGVAIPHLNKELFFNLFIPVPPLNEQKRIVNKVSLLQSLLQ